MKSKKLITLLEKDGTKSEIEYVTEFELDNNHYLVYKDPKESEDNEEVNCFFAKINKLKNGYEIDNIEDDNEYQRVIAKVSKIINGGVE